MTISLPYLWLVGHVAALLGVPVALVLAVRPNRVAAIVCVLGGAVSCGALAVILHDLNQSFFGLYRYLAWVVAFFAGIAALAPIGYLLASLFCREEKSVEE